MSADLPPHNELAEWSLVACALEKPDILPELNPAEFYCAEPRTVLERAKAASATGNPDPQVAVLMGLYRESPSLFERAQGHLNALHSAANWPAWKEEVADLSAKRDAIRFVAQLTEEAAAGDLDPHAIAERAKSLRQLAESRTSNARQCLDAMVDDLERRFALQGQLTGIATGFSRLDWILDGLQFGEQTVIGARPSVGKTAFACNVIARACLVDETPTLFATFEMSPAALTRRLLACHAGISMSELRRGTLTEGDMQKLTRFNGTMSARPIRIYNGVGTDIGALATEVRRAHRQQAVKLVVVDYLQRIKASTRNEKRTYEVAEVSNVLFALARETGAAFLTLAQLNREPDKGNTRPPRISDLGDSGQIERDADNIGLLHREAKSSEALLIVAKQRDGDTDSVPLIFDGVHCRFQDRPKERPSYDQD